MHCRFCKTPLTHKVIDLESCPPANAYLTHPNAVEAYYPLQVYVCSSCFLVQTLDYVSPGEIFNKNYAFISSASQTWKKHCEDYTASIISKLDLKAGCLVVEIGSNDGILLKCFADRQMSVLGIDPAASTSVYKKSDLNLIDRFFDAGLAKELASQGKGADLIVANNVIAHVADVNSFVEGIKILLGPAGVATIELPHLLKLIQYNQFDTIYHEHFSYFSLTVLQKIFSKHQLKILDVEELDIHGGSIRIYVSHDHKNIEPSYRLKTLLKQEADVGVETLEYYNHLQAAAFQIKSSFLLWLMNTLTAGKKVMAYGAAAKGNTFFNYCGVRKDMIPMIADVTPKKQGKYLPGSRIQIVEESAISEFKPDFTVVLPWNYKDEIDQRLAYTKEWGCKLVYLIPEFIIC
jgi:2-polyprenyl-3-methyl-5-hydroxy-6-metoxy-1,4-benzoquinol methylase